MHLKSKKQKAHYIGGFIENQDYVLVIFDSPVLSMVSGIVYVISSYFLNDRLPPTLKVS